MRILLVESDIPLATGLKANLEREFFAVDIAENPDQALNLSWSASYDLIILNREISETKGLYLVKEIRSRGRACPILVLSSEDSPHNAATILNAGADDFIGKPYSFEELLARTIALLRRPKQISPEELSVGDLCLDIKKHEVKKNNKEVILTRKEFMLLEYLMRNSGVVLSRGQILEHVWDIHADPFSNTIESHILSLRKKINDHSSKKLIQTISGRGYKIGINNS